MANKTILSYLFAVFYDLPYLFFLLAIPTCAPTSLYRTSTWLPCHKCPALFFLSMSAVCPTYSPMLPVARGLPYLPSSLSLVCLPFSHQFHLGSPHFVLSALSFPSPISHLFPKNPSRDTYASKPGTQNLVMLESIIDS